MFRNEVIVLLKIVLIYEEPLISGQLPLSLHLWDPRGWLPDRGSAVIMINLPVFFSQYSSAGDDSVSETVTDLVRGG